MMNVRFGITATPKQTFPGQTDAQLGVGYGLAEAYKRLYGPSHQYPTFTLTGVEDSFHASVAALETAQKAGRLNLAKRMDPPAPAKSWNPFARKAEAKAPVYGVDPKAAALLTTNLVEGMTHLRDTLVWQQATIRRLAEMQGVKADEYMDTLVPCKIKADRYHED